MSAIANSTIASAPSSEHPLRNANYRCWLIGGSISLLGDQFYLVALPWIALQLTASAAVLGTIMMAGAIPRLLLMLVSGAISDRISARKIMMATALARAICVAVIGMLIWQDGLQLWELYALVVAFGVADAFAGPAQAAYVPFLVKREQLVAASSITQTTAQVSMIIGPVPAGFVIQMLGAASAFFFDAISFLFIIGALWKLPDPPTVQGVRKSIWHAIIEGIAHVKRDAPLCTLMLLATVMNFCVTGPVSIGLAYLSKEAFNSPSAYGVMISAVAGGGLVGALLAGIWKIRRRGVMFVLASSLLAILLGSIGLIHGAWSIAVVLFVMGTMAGMINVHIGAWVMQRIDDAVRGRVASVLMVASIGIAPVSLAIAGLMVAWSLPLMFLFAGGLMLAVAFMAALQRSVWELE
jgi:MFS family permease